MRDLIIIYIGILIIILLAHMINDEVRITNLENEIRTMRVFPKHFKNIIELDKFLK